MGGVAKKVVTGPLGLLPGMEGKQGEYYKPDWQQRAGDQLFKESEYAMGGYGVNQTAADLMKGYEGGKSAMDTLSKADQPTHRVLAESPLLGSLLAQDMLQHGGITKQIYGKDGEFSKSLADVDAMRKPGAYGLTADDQTAYGQMSGNLARMFGQSEGQLAGDLASRGLAGAESGVAGKQYSGLQGNKMEQFAGLQRQIADQAMQRAMQRDQMLRNYAMQMQRGAAGDIQDQFGRQLAGNSSARNMLATAAGMENQNNMGKMQADMASMQDKRAAYEPGAYDMLTGGLKNSFYQVGAAPGNFIGNASGSLGSAFGGQMGGSMMGGGGGSQQNYSGTPSRTGQSAGGKFSNPQQGQYT